MLLDKMILNEKVRETIHGEYYKSVFKFEPTRRIINIGTTPYFLSFPEIYFSLITRIKGGKHYFVSIKAAFGDGKTDNLYYAAFRNMWGDLSFCAGMPRGKQFDSLVECAQFTLDRFWNSSFNSDLGGNPYPTELLIKTPLRSIEIWSRQTKANPKWIPTANQMKQIRHKGQLNYFGKK